MSQEKRILVRKCVKVCLALHSSFIYYYYIAMESASCLSYGNFFYKCDPGEGFQ